MKRLSLTIAFLLGAASLCLAEAGKPLILREPSVSRTQIVFSYAGSPSGLQAGTVVRRGG